MARDLNDTLIFVKVVEQGSFVAAARALGLPKTTVSRKVQELEQRLGARLLNRTTRRLGLTEAGAVYHEHCQRIARELDEAESAVSELQSGPRGWLRFTAPYHLTTTWIAPLLGEFSSRHPEIRIEMIVTNDRVDLISREIDIALRVGALPDSTLVARRLATFRTQVYAGPRYLERHGEPRQPEELQYHRALTLSAFRRNGRYLWQLSNGERSEDFVVYPVFVANDPTPLTSALLSGEGLLLASDVSIKPFVASGAARRVLPGWRGPEVELNAVFPSGLVTSPKVRLFIDFLVERLRFDTDFMSRMCPNLECGEVSVSRQHFEPEPVEETAVA